MDATRYYHIKWEQQIPHDITYMWNLKHGTNEPVRETEMDADTQNKPMLTKGERGWTTDKLGVWG